MNLSITLFILLLFSSSSFKSEQKNQDMNQNKIVTIDFYHDVICSWCYVISPRLRKLEKENKNIIVNHRSFALAPNTESIIDMFGSREEGKKQIMEHWRNSSCSLDDDICKINTDLMESKTFDYPHSMPGLIACKAAEKQGGRKMHWDFFDAIQIAHLVESKNIDSPQTLIDIAKKLELDVEQFEKDIKSAEMREMVIKDIRKAHEMGVNSVPTIIINGKQKISGARPYKELKEIINNIVKL